MLVYSHPFCLRMDGELLNSNRHQPYDIVSMLEGMRDDYWKGVSEPEKGPEYLVECVLLMLGGILCAFETSYAVEVIRMPRFAVLPSAGEKSLVKGAFTLRGEMFLATDIRPLLALPLVPLEKYSRIILVKSPSFTTGILAESVLEVAELSYGSFQAIDTGSFPSNPEFFRGRLMFNSIDAYMLDMDALLASPEIAVDLSLTADSTAGESEK